MIKHVSMVKFKENADGCSKEENIQKAVELCNELAQKIPEIRNLEVGVNITDGPNAFDLVSMSEYADMAAAKTTMTHPVHDKFVAFLKKVVEFTYSVNYEK